MNNYILSKFIPDLIALSYYVNIDYDIVIIDFVLSVKLSNVVSK